MKGPDKILEALNFLKMNNPFYSDIIIGMEQTSLLPINYSNYEMIPTVDLPEVNTCLLYTSRCV